MNRNKSGSQTVVDVFSEVIDDQGAEFLYCYRPGVGTTGMLLDVPLGGRSFPPFSAFVGRC